MNLEVLKDLANKPGFLYAALAGAVGCLVGWLAAKVRALRRSRLKSRTDTEERDRDTESRDLRKTVYLLQNENTKLSTFLMTLPDLARQLNSNVERRKIPGLLISFIEGLFEAEQILIFLTTADGKNLTLTASKGLQEGSHLPKVIPFGKGRIGWVAWHQITMDESDFSQKSRTEKSEIASVTHATFRTELCAPLVAKEQTLGVISLGGLLRRPKNEKNMLKMVADLGSIAIQNKMLLNQVQASADTDGLTSLPNKRYFMARMADEVIKAENSHKVFSVFIFDIDHFKSYNDTHGHVAGDEALKITGRLLAETVRPDDLPARYGGEEFVVLLPDTDKEGAAVAAEKIRNTIEQFAYPKEESQPNGRVTISGGVATFPYDAKSMADLIRCADKALYKGKHAGRNRVCLYEQRYLSEETGVGGLPPATDLQEM